MSKNKTANGELSKILLWLRLLYLQIYSNLLTLFVRSIFSEQYENDLNAYLAYRKVSKFMPKQFYENGLKHVLSNQVIHNLKTGNLMLDHFINLPKKYIF